LFNRIAKLLVFCTDDKRILYELSKSGLFVEKIIPIITHKDKKLIPKMVVIKYEKNSHVSEFLRNSSFKSYRIFKSACFTKNFRDRAFLLNVAMNLLSLCKGKTLRIRSKDKEKQQKFYEICQTLNKEHNLGVKFDFDNYDIQVILKIYKEPKKTHYIVIAPQLTYFLEIKPKVRAFLKTSLASGSIIIWPSLAILFDFNPILCIPATLHYILVLIYCRHLRKELEK